MKTESYQCCQEQQASENDFNQGLSVESVSKPIPGLEPICVGNLIISNEMEEEIILNADKSGMSEVTGVQNAQVSNGLPPLPTWEELQERNAREEVEDLMEFRVLPETEVPEEEFCFEVKGEGIFPKDDIHAIHGKAKTGKTTILQILLAALFCGRIFKVKALIKMARILWIDTEQKLKHVKKIIERSKLMSKVDDDYIREHLWLFHFRRRTYETLCDDTEKLIRYVKPDIVFIDGIVDYVHSFNDEVESKDIIDKLINMSEAYHCSIVNVLHENKSPDDESMRGHLGARLQQKGNDILQCKIDTEEIITVSSPCSRHAKMTNWSIRYDAEGNIVDADIQHQLNEQQKKAIKDARNQAKKEKLENERTEIAVQIVRNNGGEIERTELKEKLMEKLHLEKSTCQSIIRYSLERGALKEEKKGVISIPEETIVDK